MLNRTMIVALLTVAALTASANAAGIFISELVEGAAYGTYERYLELTNATDADYTFGANSGIVFQANAGNIHRNIGVDLAGVTIAAGDSFVISRTPGSMAIMGLEPEDMHDGYINNRGYDRYILVEGGVDIDMYGVDGVDGQGTAWEFTDSYAYRLPHITEGNGGVFDVSEWYVAPIGSLIGVNDDDAVNKLATYTTPGTHDFVPEPASMALLTLGALAVVRRRR